MARPRPKPGGGCGQRILKATEDRPAAPFKNALKKTDKVLTVVFETANSIKYEEIKFHGQVLQHGQHTKILDKLRCQLMLHRIFVDRVLTAQTLGKWIESAVSSRLQERQCSLRRLTRSGTAIATDSPPYPHRPYRLVQEKPGADHSGAGDTAPPDSEDVITETKLRTAIEDFIAMGQAACGEQHRKNRKKQAQGAAGQLVAGGGHAR